MKIRFASFAARFGAGVLMLGIWLTAPSAHAQCTTPPTITFQPSDAAQFEGQPVTFDVGATSPAGCEPLTYAWYELVGVDGNLDFIPDATNTSLTVIATAYPNDPDRNR